MSLSEQSTITVWDIGDEIPVTVAIVDNDGAPAAPANGVNGYYLKPGGIRTAFPISATAVVGTYEGSLVADVSGDWFWSAETDGADPNIRKLFEEHTFYVRPAATTGGLIASNALTSLGATRAWCLRDETDGSRDALFARLINSVSAEIIRYLDREVFPTNATTRYFTYDGGGYLDLAPYELRSVTSITLQSAGELDAEDPLHAGGDGTNLPDYRLEPRNKTPEGTYLWMRLPEMRNWLAVPGKNHVGLQSEVAITGDWGMAAPPADLETAVLQTIEWRYKNPAAARSVQTGPAAMESYNQQPDSSVQFPAEAQAILDAIRRSR